MKLLHELLDEVLYHISSNFEHDLNPLSSLCLVCHTNHRSTRSLLFRHIQELSPERSNLLQRSLLENTELQALIASWYFSFYNNGFSEDEVKIALSLPNVRTLMFKRQDKCTITASSTMDQISYRVRYLILGRPAEWDFERHFLDNTNLGFSNIRTINLEQDFTTTELLRFMLLPSVRVVKATYLDIMKPHDLPATWANEKSNITKLILDGGAL